ncbi:MAG: PQQ-binding-like beta-propeller repeat protein [Bacteroidota bacterium]
MKTKALFLLIILSAGLSLYSQEITHWRGPSANGCYPDKGLLKQWPESGPALLWSYDELGQGHSSVTVAGDAVFIPTMKDGTGYICKLTLDGKLVWKVPYGNEFTESFPGSRSSVTIAGDQLYMLSGYGKLVCMSKADGKQIWTASLVSDYDGDTITWGFTETVVVDGDVLYCTPGGKVNNVIALNRHTGKLIWSSKGKGELSAYCTPLLITLPECRILVTHTQSSILGIDIKDGKLLWSYPHPNEWSVHPNTPLYNNGMVFCYSGYGQGGVMLKLENGGTSVTKVWSTKNLDPRVGGAVAVNGYIYGSGDYNRAWQCLDWNTGEEKYSATDIAKGDVIYADGMLYCYSERGELALVPATPSGFKVVSKIKITKGSEQHWAIPVIHNGVLYIHHGSSLMAYEIK